MQSKGAQTNASGRRRFLCRVCNRSTTAASNEELGERDGLGYDPELAASNHDRLTALRKSGHKRWVITAAQNNTRIHTGFAALEHYCNLTGAELIVIPMPHKNVSLFVGRDVYQRSWPASLQKYIIDRPLNLGGGVEVQAQLNISPTAARPLSAAQPVGGHRWQIFGHSKMLMEPVATPQNVKPKRLYTTGCCTVRNYSQTKAGALASFHHTPGALVVEVAGRDIAFVRQLHFTGDSFFDVHGGELWEYGPDWYAPHDRILALTTGDEHVKFMDPKVKKATYGPGGICERLQPKAIFRHDVLDGYARSHHHERDPVLQFKKFHAGDDDYRAELDEVVRHLNDTTPRNSVSYIVDSNHHDHLRQWLDRADANKDHRNAMLILEMQQMLREAALAGRDVSALQLYCEGRLTADVRWLGRDTPHLIKGVDYSQHGDIGVNGARGSALSLSKTTYKTVIGHSHTARIVDGCYQVGHSAGRLDYAKGMGTWTHTHCLQYPDGKRTLVDIQRGRWHG